MYNNPFSSNFSSSNPFAYTPGNGNKALENDLLDTYSKLEALKQQQQSLNQQPVLNTVFTDIANEMKDLSEDEQAFIINSKEYIEKNNAYQTEFSEFITAKFANEYLQSGHGRSLEELLGVIKKRKDQYKSKFASDISEIRTQNQDLLDKNNTLAASNAELQRQLLEIQAQLSKGN